MEAPTCLVDDEVVERQASEAAFHTYMSRFAKSTEEEVAFDTKTFSWNVENLIYDGQAANKEDDLIEDPTMPLGRPFSMWRTRCPEPSRPQEKHHYNIPSCIKQKSQGVDIVSKLSDMMRDAKQVQPPTAPIQPVPVTLANDSKMGRRAPVVDKFTSLPIGGTASPLALAFSLPPSKGVSTKANSMKPSPSKLDVNAGCKVSPCQSLVNDDFGYAIDLDANSHHLCPHCSLPLGDFVYRNDFGEGSMVHSECLAQRMLLDLKDDDSTRQQNDKEEKLLRRLQYDIGWKVEQIPRNFGLLQKLKCMISSHGMCCLVLQEETKTVRLAQTLESSAAVNLEYLSLALQVRRREGREPLFSLDPIDRGHGKSQDEEYDRDASQIKRFEPEWLAGTSAGDVLFQSDYHLKELSMGECDQPVVGMKSCFEYSEEEDMMKESWSAREWFMVRKAEIHLSEDNALIPQVKMGVEAREQVRGANGLEDAPITRQNHPMVKYAESFTKNFDLIAERKSVVYHLRELAKASVIAKFLIDADIQVEEAWFNLAGEMEEACSLEIPQLWNERAHSKIHLRDGAIVGAGSTRLHGVYGGVQFGLDKFDISRVAPRKRVVVSGPSLASQSELRSVGDISAAGLRAKPAPGRPRAVAPLTSQVSSQSLANLISPVSMESTPLLAAVPLSSTLPAIRPGIPSLVAGGIGVQPMMSGPPLGEINPYNVPALLSTAGTLSAGPGLGRLARGPQGVDLNLNQFSLDTPQQVVEGNWVCDQQTAEASKPMADAFWSCVADGKECVGEKEQMGLLKSIFNPHLCDRRAEGDVFAPPDTSLTYVNKLRSLVCQEAEVRRQRINHFVSTAFFEEKPGSLFPLSWTESMEISRPRACKQQHGTLWPRTGYAAEADQVLKSGAPAFERKAEDGMIFRIYRVGSLEVRTTQAHDQKEIVGVIFSIREKSARHVGRTATGAEKIIKVTEYVEKVRPDSQNLSQLDFKYYVVLDTEKGITIVTEQVEDTVVWEESAEDVEDRNSLAKVVRTACCRGAGVRVQDLRNKQAQKATQHAFRGTRSKSQVYATSVYTQAVGGAHAALKASQKTERDGDVAKDADAEDEELEQRLVHEAASVEVALLTPCSECSAPFAPGFKKYLKGWICNTCWLDECEKKQVENAKPWQDGW